MASHLPHPSLLIDLLGQRLFLKEQEQLPPQEFHVPTVASLKHPLVSVVNHNSFGLNISLPCPTPVGVQTTFFYLPHTCLSAVLLLEREIWG